MRWKTNAYKGHVRSHEVDAKAVSDILADAGTQSALQPGQRTVRDINGYYN